MAHWELIFFWITMVIYALSAGGYIYSIVFKNPKVLSTLTAFIGIGLIMHTCAIGARYSATGHLPWSGDYESALMGGWFLIGATLYMGWSNRSLQGLAMATVPLVMLMMAFGYMRNPMLTPLAASLKTFWLYIHVYFAWLAFGAYTMGMAAGVLYILKHKDASRPVRNPTYERFPSLERLDELIFRYVVFGFLTDTIMIVAGAIWAKDLWGSYWSWDPIETWSLISWIIYGIAIHLRITFGWRNQLMAWVAIAALSTVIISFFGVTFVVSNSLHTFNLR